jgi:hypothetical protein
MLELMTLLLCQVCARHVKTSESECPFCHAAVVAGPPPPRAEGRVSRATAAAIALSASVAITACGGDKTPSPAADASSDVEPVPTAVPAYGAPAPFDAGTDAPVVGPAYGAPAPDGG